MNTVPTVLSAALAKEYAKDRQRTAESWRLAADVTGRRLHSVHRPRLAWVHRRSTPRVAGV